MHVMEDLQQIIPDRVKQATLDPRTRQFLLIGAVIFLALLSVTFIALYSHKHVQHDRMTSAPSAQKQSAGPNVCFSGECLDAASWMRHNMKPEVDPCDDFYEFACGGWAEREEIPPERSFVSTRTKLFDSELHSFQTKNLLTVYPVCTFVPYIFFSTTVYNT